MSFPGALCIVLSVKYRIKIARQTNTGGTNQIKSVGPVLGGSANTICPYLTSDEK